MYWELDKAGQLTAAAWEESTFPWELIAALRHLNYPRDAVRRLAIRILGSERRVDDLVRQHERRELHPLHAYADDFLWSFDSWHGPDGLRSPDCPDPALCFLHLSPELWVGGWKDTGDLIREVIGPCLDMPIFLEDWMACTVLDLADGIRADKAFDRMPILADALEEAGCDNARILGHCRQDRPHDADCWVLRNCRGF
jgi:hypothetical protein